MSKKKPTEKVKTFNVRKFKAIWFSVLVFLIALTVTANVLANVFHGGLTVFLDGAVTYEFSVVVTLDEYPYEVTFTDTTGEGLAAQVDAFVATFDLDIDLDDLFIHFPSDFATKEDAFAHGVNIAMQIASEGAILLKNDNNTLPLPAGSRVSVFGNTATHPVYGGTGSGDLGDIVVPNINEVLRDVAGYIVNPTLAEWYAGRRERRGDISMYGGGSTFWIGEVPMEVFPRNPHEHFNYADYSDAAIIVLGRPGGEGDDLLRDMTTRGARGLRGEHQLMLDYDEQNLVAHVTEHFDNVIVIINSSTMMEIGCLADNPAIGAILWIGAPGYGIYAFGNILNGNINPSGRTVMITARNMLANPVIYNFGFFAYGGDLQGYHFVEYVEGIYVGYRFYETRFIEDDEYWQHVVFPFGFGLSYTTFEWELLGTTHPEGASIHPDETMEITVRVHNTGDVAGMDVVQVYSSPPWTPGGIEKSRVNLVGFAKTGNIAPGGSYDVTVEVPVRWMASWDWNDANNNGFIGWELEEGTYYLMIQTDSRRLSAIEPIAVVSDGFLIEYDEVTGTRIRPLFDDVTLDLNQNLSRSDWEGTWPTNHTGLRTPSDEVVAAVTAVRDNMAWVDPDIPMPTQGAPGSLTLADMIGAEFDDPRWEQLLDIVSVDEMRYMIESAGFRTASIDSIVKPATLDVDGPAALNVPMGFVEIVGGAGAGISFDGRTAFPSSSTLASTWNQELAYEFGRAIGNEALHVEPTVSGWYAPGMNSHRSPFGGRVFEYISEDPIHGGLMGANVVRGMTDMGVTTYVKHFAINEQETERANRLLTWVNEQAMREIYLRQFELAVKIGGSQGMMSAFNYIGPRWAGGCPYLLRYLLRDEWGFRGTVITDFALAGTGGGYMNPDQAIRAGNDTILNPWGDNRVADISCATTVHFLREATHNVLWSTVNSNAMNGFANPTLLEEAMAAAAFPGNIGATTQEAQPPTWYAILVGVNIALGVLIAAVLGFIIVKLMGAGKKNTGKKRTA